MGYYGKKRRRRTRQRIDSEIPQCINSEEQEELQREFRKKIREFFNNMPSVFLLHHDEEDSKRCVSVFFNLVRNKQASK